MREWNAKNCAILEIDGDGKICGRCWHYLPDGVTCPIHGDVKLVQARYLLTGELTLESEGLNKRENA